MSFFPPPSPSPYASRRDNSSISGNRELCWAIARRILESPERCISFADFMEMALYHAEWGYYASREPRIGARGDFVTSPHLGADFGELLAEQFVQMWQVLGRPRPFHLVEMGAGQGLIVRDVLRYLHRRHFDCFEALEYLIIEKSAALIAEQQRVASLAEMQARIRWCQWEDLPTEGITGCFFSNELVDAFPVHQVVLHQGTWREVYVTLADSDRQGTALKQADLPDMLPKFTEVLGDLSSPGLQSYFAWVGLDISPERYPEGYRTEINLAALDWVKTVAHHLRRGYVLTIDYGYPATRLYSPVRSQGTLQCYYQHAHHDNPYQYIGQQDITAHVDFTALERQGQASGLEPLGLTQQGLFLMALGLGDRIAALSYPDDHQAFSMNDLLRRREALHGLISPLGLGNFQVLLQGKGLSQTEQEQALKGFETPPLGAEAGPGADASPQLHKS